MMTLEQIRESLKDRRLKVVAEKTGLHYNTVLSVRDDVLLEPSHKTVRLLSDYLESCCNDVR